MMQFARLTLLIITLITGSAVHAENISCRRPQLGKFLLESLPVLGMDGSNLPDPEADYFPFLSDGRHLSWMAASWLAPKQGAIFVVDCLGRRLASAFLGFTRRLRSGPELPGVGQTIEVIYITTTGTGLEEDTVGLLSFQGGKIRFLWKHVALGSVSLGIQKPYTDLSEWTYGRNGTIIRLKNAEVPRWMADWTKFPSIPRDAKLTSSETYCLRVAEQRFVACAEQPGTPKR